ncbi:hypothetical protein [Humisphaera borealis]|uniref:Uncharacterized protein n=1 Tax=Humisphaera borealis TaxID=2807512 RepID=A0A7M2X195_9BACT|nr:hypothetical protein [Humisphaera borealis]QOV91518.1 hypothetical protein IPV69_09230 [Humisphaera borealis]
MKQMLTPSKQPDADVRKENNPELTIPTIRQHLATSIGRRIAATTRREDFPAAPSLIMED